LGTREERSLKNDRTAGGSLSIRMLVIRLRRFASLASDDAKQIRGTKWIGHVPGKKNRIRRWPCAEKSILLCIRTIHPITSPGKSKTPFDRWKWNT
jgi:hypothetical protein